jgi:hypothetical protein
VATDSSPAISIARAISRHAAAIFLIIAFAMRSA